MECVLGVLARVVWRDLSEKRVFTTTCNSLQLVVLRLSCAMFGMRNAVFLRGEACVNLKLAVM